MWGELTACYCVTNMIIWNLSTSVESWINLLWASAMKMVIHVAFCLLKTKLLFHYQFRSLMWWCCQVSGVYIFKLRKRKCWWKWGIWAWSLKKHFIDLNHCIEQDVEVEGAMAADHLNAKFINLDLDLNKVQGKINE